MPYARSAASKFLLPTATRTAVKHLSSRLCTPPHQTLLLISSYNHPIRYNLWHANTTRRIAVLVMSRRNVDPLPSNLLKAFVTSQTQPPQRPGEEGDVSGNATVAVLMKSFKQCANARIHVFRTPFQLHLFQMGRKPRGLVRQCVQLRLQVSRSYPLGAHGPNPPAAAAR